MPLKAEKEEEFIVGDDEEITEEAESTEEETEETEVVESDKEEETKELGEAEELALELGWNPNHEGDDAVDARTFILRSRDIQDTMRKTNRESKRQIADMKRGIDNIKDYYRKLDDARTNKMEAEIERLKAQKYDAVEEGDVEKVKEIEIKIDEAEKESEPLMDEDYSNPVFDEWVDDNDWYGKDEDMTDYADAQSKLEKYKGVPPKRVLKMIGESAREMFPDQFETKSIKSKVTPKVEGTKPSRGKRAPTRADMTSEQKEIMKNILSVDESFTEKEYIKGLHEAGEI